MRATAISAAAALTVTMGVAVGCGSSKPPICSDLAALKTSVQNLRDVQLNASSLSTIGDDVTKIKSQVTTLKSAAKSQYSSQITVLQNSLTTLSGAVTTARASPGLTTLAAVGSGASGVASSAKALESAVSGTC